MNYPFWNVIDSNQLITFNCQGLQANDFHEISKRYSLPTKLSHLFINNIYNNNPNLIITSADSIHDENECISLKTYGNKRKHTVNDIHNDTNLEYNERPRKKLKCKNKIEINISDLLTLPQKEAANLLGISESMLCKRFKASTQRKWPYRYLQKLEKSIKCLESMKKVGRLTINDLRRLDELKRERNNLLNPVSISLGNINESILKRLSLLKKNNIEEDNDEIAVRALKKMKKKQR